MNKIPGKNPLVNRKKNRKNPPVNNPPDWSGMAIDLAKHFWGKPNEALSDQRELRWGKQGSKSLNINRGVWFDRDAGYGGGVIDLVVVELKKDRRDAVQWLRERGFF